MITIAQLVHFFEPWQSAYSNSAVLPSVVTAVHLTALLFGGGLAVSSDRSLLRAFRAGDPERIRVVHELHAVHRPVLVALALMFMSGVLLATADVKTFLTTPVFYLKLTLVMLLVLNGAVLTRTESVLRRMLASGHDDRTPPVWRRLRATSWCSLVLWTATLITGVVLVNVS